GVLFINFRRAQSFDAPQRQLVDGLSNYAAIAIHNSRRFIASSSRHRRELDILYAIDRSLVNKESSIQDLFKTILQLAKEHVAAVHVSLFRMDISNKSVEHQ